MLSNEILDIYLNIVSSLDIGVIEAFGEEADKKHMSFNESLEKYLSVFRNMTNVLKN
jgi:hypothetical protein